MREFFPTLERLLRAVAPHDLGDKPLYFVLSGDVPELADVPGFGGFVSPSIDTLYREHLIPAWHGRGVAIVFNAAEIERCARAKGQTVWRELVGVALHELAHVLAEPYYGGDWTPPAEHILPAVRREVREYFLSPEEIDATSPVWAGHGPRFFQAAMHLHYRAAVLGEAVAPAAIINNYRYIRAATNEFRVALGDEPARMVNEPFRRIRDGPLPAAFSRLWNERAEEFFDYLIRTRQTKVRTTMNVVLERIKTAKAAAEGEKLKSYLALVRDTATGNEVDPAAAAEVLSAAGKSCEDLEADAGKVAERERIRSELAKLPKLRQQRDELQATIDAANVELEAAQQKYADTTKPAAEAIRAIVAALREENTLRQKLLATCLDTEAAAAWEAAREKLGKAKQERDKLRPEERTMREFASGSLGLAAQAEYKSHAQSHEATAARQTKVADDLGDRIAVLDAEIESLAVAEREARERVEAA